MKKPILIRLQFFKHFYLPKLKMNKSFKKFKKDLKISLINKALYSLDEYFSTSF